MKLQLDIPEDINLQLKIYKLKHKLVTIGDAVNKILEEKFSKKEVKEKTNGN